MLRRLGPTLWAVLAFLAGGCSGDDRPPPHVLLITLDTQRADHLEPYGSTVTRTPNVTRLAAEGTLFENAAAPMPLTRPSHSTLFTSRHPRQHGVTDNHLALPEDEVTLAERFREAGYRTAAFLGAGVVGPTSGLLQGFEYHETPRPGYLPAAARVVERAVAWLRTLGPEERFFLWVHVFDPHMPYAPDPFYIPPAPPEGPRLDAVSWEVLRDLAHRNRGLLDAGVLRRARELYAAEVTASDAALGVLLLELAEPGPAGRTVTVLTADHGECLEKGFFFRHGGCLYEGAVRVPLIVRYPGIVPAGMRVTPQVRHLDVAPTILTLAGLEAPEAFAGEPLFRADGTPVRLSDDRLALVQHPVSAVQEATARRWIWSGVRKVAGVPMRPSPVGVQQLALRSARWKYIATTGGAEELYDLAADPAETRDLAPAHRDLTLRFRSALRQRIEELPLKVLAPAELTPAMREELEALGYL